MQVNSVIKDMILSVKYQCKYCKTTDQMMTPVELETHLIRQCPGFLKEMEKTHKKVHKCNDCKQIKMEGHFCKKSKNSWVIL